MEDHRRNEKNNERQQKMEKLYNERKMFSSKYF